MNRDRSGCQPQVHAGIVNPRQQNARSGLAISDWGAVLDGGVVKLVGPGRQLLDDPEVGRLYLGAAAGGGLGAAAAGRQ
jgi:ABC-type lipopolysaccharide export system ATPase subunit